MYNINLTLCRTLVLAEGDVTLRYYEGEDGKKRLDFSVIHRASSNLICNRAVIIN